ncbi:hypothetical protein P9112_008466 [Eukaryota sp. TZLM1-RC]
MRMRCYLWPCNLPNDLFCKCGAGLTLSHLFNCSRYISYRSTLHDAVRDQIHAMCNSYHIESFVEPLLRSLDINESVRDSEYGKRRADVVVPSGCLQEKCLEKCSIRSIPLDDSELYKRKKYANPLKELKHVRHVDYQICPFAISLYGRLGKTALNFIDDFENLVKKRMNKHFDRRLWLNRIVFTIFKSIPKMISKALMSVSAHYENIAAVRNCFKKKFGNRKIVKSKICRKLCLRGRYGAAKQSLFSSSLADANSDTLEKLQKLHPQENFKCSKPEVCPFWIENPITAIEVHKAIQKLPKGKAAGPSGISFDLLKIACSSAPEIADDLAHYFQQLIVLKINPPFELLAARLIALVKPGNGIKPDGIRPIAVGESLSRLLASIVFDRVKDKASTFFYWNNFYF